MTHSGSSWFAVHEAQPTFATEVESRFGRSQHGVHHVLGTLRADGSPRLSGLEVDFRDGELWLGMMANSRKALDLRRDPRFSLFAEPGDPTGERFCDVRIAGRAAEVTDPAVLRWYTGELPEGHVPELFHLFRAEVTEIVRYSLEIPYWVVEHWRPGRPLRKVRRGNDDTPPEEVGEALAEAAEGAEREEQRRD